MAPEILKKEQYDKTADWWSVGIILYQMLTGTHPFFDRNMHRQNMAIIKNPVPIPNQVRVPHSDAFADLVIKLLAKDPRDRLGKGGASEILEHEYFSDCNFDDYMENKKAVQAVHVQFECHMFGSLQT